MILIIVILILVVIWLSIGLYTYSRRLQDISDNLCAEYSEKAAEAERQYQMYRVLCEKQLATYERQVEGLRQQYDAQRDALQRDYDNWQLEFNSKRQLAEIELKEQEDEIQQYKAQRAQLIEAFKLDEQERSAKLYYQVQLSEQDLLDIEFFKSIEHHIANKEALSKLIWSTYYQKPTKELLNRIIGANKTSGIYKITNLNNNKVYIGQSVDVANRLIEHIKSSLGIGSIAAQKIHDAIRADGITNFTFELLEACPKSELNKKEISYIDIYQANVYGYNRTAGGS